MLCNRMVDKVTLVEIENPHPNARPAKLMAHEQELATIGMWMLRLPMGPKDMFKDS